MLHGLHLKTFAAIVALAPAAALAEVPDRHTGPYLSLSGGVYSPSYFEAEGTGLERIHARRGPEVGLAVGYAFERWRLELEGSYARNGFKCFTLHTSNGGCRNVGGSFSTYRAGVNVARDFFTRRWPVQPYVEGGMGAQILDVNLGTPQSVNGYRKEWALKHGRGWTSVRPTWHVGVGVRAPVSERVILTLGTRYTAGIGANTINGGDGSGGPGWGGGSSFEVEGLSTRIGIQWGF